MFKSQIDLTMHRKALTSAQVAINRYAMLQLKSRPNIQHATKGKPLSTQLDLVWKSVIANEIQGEFKEEFRQKIEMIIGTADKADTVADKASKGDEGK